MEPLTWAEDTPAGVPHLSRGDGWRCVTNLSGAVVPLPAGEMLLSSGPLEEEGGPGPDATVWLGP